MLLVPDNIKQAELLEEVLSKENIDLYDYIRWLLILYMEEKISRDVILNDEEYQFFDKLFWKKIFSILKDDRYSAVKHEQYVLDKTAFDKEINFIKTIKEMLSSDDIYVPIVYKPTNSINLTLYWADFNTLMEFILQFICTDQINDETQREIIYDTFDEKWIPEPDRRSYPYCDLAINEKWELDMRIKCDHLINNNLSSIITIPISRDKDHIIYIIKTFGKYKNSISEAFDYSYILNYIENIETEGDS